MSSIASANTLVEKRTSIYDTLPSLESWYQNNTIEQEENICLRRIRRKNNKVVSFCTDPPVTYTFKNEEEVPLSHYNEKGQDYVTSTGCCGNIKVKSFIRSFINK